MSPAVYVALNTLPTQMLGILHKKGLSLLTLFISLMMSSLMWSHWTTLVHLGTKADRQRQAETQQRLLALGRDVSRWLSDVGFWSPSGSYLG